MLYKASGVGQGLFLRACAWAWVKARRTVVKRALSSRNDTCKDIPLALGRDLDWQSPLVGNRIIKTKKNPCKINVSCHCHGAERTLMGVAPRAAHVREDTGLPNVIIAVSCIRTESSVQGVAALEVSILTRQCRTPCSPAICATSLSSYLATIS